MKKLISLVVLMAFVGAAGSVGAAGNAAAGKGRSAVCAGCHGVDGNSAAPNFPKLAGQDGQYIAKQLADFKSGARKDPTMIGMVAALSKKDMDDLGAYYASQKRSTGTTSASAADLKKAERLYRGGDAKNSIPACMSCHGPAGTGIPPRFPSVSGQHATYSQKQLLDFKTGARSNDSEVMTRTAFRLSEAEIKAVAEYMAALH
jgi:cytochrome c553